MLAMWSATGARFMIMLSDVVGLRAFVIVMVNLSVRHTRRMPGGILAMIILLGLRFTTRKNIGLFIENNQGCV